MKSHPQKNSSYQICTYVALSGTFLILGLPKVIGVEPRVVEGEVHGAEGQIEVKEEEEDLQDGEKILKDWDDVKEETNTGEVELKKKRKR